MLGTRKGYERSTVTNPLSAAAVVALAGDGAGRPEIEGAIAHYDYSKINVCEFFLAEVAYYALPQQDSAANAAEGFVNGSLVLSNGFPVKQKGL